MEMYTVRSFIFVSQNQNDTTHFNSEKMQVQIKKVNILITVCENCATNRIKNCLEITVNCQS